MKPCTVLEALFSKYPDVMNREIYREHIETCPQCKSDEAVLGDFIAVLQETDAEGRARVPSLDRQHRLMEAAARHRPTSMDRRRVGIRWAMAASVLFAAGALVFYLTPPAPAPQSDIIHEPTVSVKRLVSGKNFLEEVPTPHLGDLSTGRGEQLRILINRDALSVMEETKISITSTRHSQTQVRIESGTVHFAVSKRKGGDSFVVESLPYRVRVIGTRFSVSRWNTEEMTVFVSEGQVEVSAPKTSLKQIAAGEHIYFSKEHGINSKQTDIDEISVSGAAVDDAVLSFEPDGGSPARTKKDGPRNLLSSSPERRSDMDAWRRMIVAGAYIQAENEIHAYLAHRPEDWQAWSLLADCLRKERKWEGSVASYEKLISLAPPGAANRARLTASAVLQNELGQHLEAARLLEAYLQLSDDGASLKAEIMVRLAKSYIKLKQMDRARELLLQVVSRHRGNPIAKKAEALLHQIAPSSSVPDAVLSQ